MEKDFLEDFSSYEPIEEEIVLKPKKIKVKDIEITVTAVTNTKILGATKEGNGHAIFRSSKNKDVKVGDKITIR